MLNLSLINVVAMRDKLFQIFFCIYIFWGPLACVVLGQQGLSMNGNIMRILLIIIFVLSFFFYLRNGRLHSDKKIWIILVIFGACFYSTRFFYGDNADYQGQFLRWGADCISACLIGITLMKQSDFSYIHKILPIVCIILTPFFVQGTLTNAVDQPTMHLDSGMSYQSVAYYLAVLFCMSSYYALAFKDSTKKIIWFLLILCLPIQAVTCCMSGGRGGLVLFCVYLVVMAYVMLKFIKVSKVKILLGSIIGVVLFSYVANRFNLWDSAGFQRSSGLLNDNDRFELWKPIWRYIENNSYLGYGLGGDYFTFGFYTHNIFIDFLLETGIIGTIILIVFFFKVYKNIFIHCWSDDIFILLMIISIYGLVMNLFSGYWITTYSHWLAIGVSMTSNRYFNKFQNIK